MHFLALKYVFQFFLYVLSYKYVSTKCIEVVSCGLSVVCYKSILRTFGSQELEVLGGGLQVVGCVLRTVSYLSSFSLFVFLVRVQGLGGRLRSQNNLLSLIYQSIRQFGQGLKVKVVSLELSLIAHLKIFVHSWLKADS